MQDPRPIHITPTQQPTHTYGTFTHSHTHARTSTLYPSATARAAVYHLYHLGHSPYVHTRVKVNRSQKGHKRKRDEDDLNGLKSR
mgnify:CR=1 FL=1